MRSTGLRYATSFLLSFFLLTMSSEAEEPKILRKEITVRAPVSAVWNAWTTNEGLTFVSAKSNVDVRLGGPYEWFLDLPADGQGRRGGEGSRVLAFVPEEMIAFSWTFPPSIPELRDAGEKTQVVVRFDEVGEREVRVELVALGWQEGEPWERGFEYFDQAWGYVLEQLRGALEVPLE